MTERIATAWGEFGDGHDYSRTGKHLPQQCRFCLRHQLAKVEASELASRTVKAEAKLSRLREENAKLREVLAGTPERVSLAGFLKRLEPHIDHEDWKQAAREFAARADAALASTEG